MDQLVLAQKLESLRRCVARIREKTPVDTELLLRDPDLQDILVLNITRAVQLCVDIGSHIISETDEAAPTTMGEVFSILEVLGAISSETAEPLKKAIGFRNIAVHNYSAINWEIVFAICEKSPTDFRQFAKEVSDYAHL